MMLLWNVVLVGVVSASLTADTYVAVPGIWDWVSSAESGNVTKKWSEAWTVRDVLQPFFEAKQWMTPVVTIREPDGLSEAFLDDKEHDDMTVDEFLGDLDGKSAVFRAELLDSATLPPIYDDLLGSARDKIFGPDGWSAHLYVSSPGASALGNHTDITDVRRPRRNLLSNFFIFRTSNVVWDHSCLSVVETQLTIFFFFLEFIFDLLPSPPEREDIDFESTTGRRLATGGIQGMVYVPAVASFL